jgi:hypothetical protein
MSALMPRKVNDKTHQEEGESQNESERRQFEGTGEERDKLKD